MTTKFITLALESENGEDTDINVGRTETVTKTEAIIMFLTALTKEAVDAELSKEDLLFYVASFYDNIEDDDDSVEEEEEEQ